MTELEQLQASAEQAATLLKAMSNPHRLLILCTLCDAPEPARAIWRAPPG
ncbi:regulatory protein ArsR [Enterobacter cancerogenus]|uniref:Regulatory protein ArsR n=1 Tax=Enterobacter cancerogenus TaxID=69218 RepID=A0A484Z7E0_9ENTR|nr:regulatory protein ArsR [Enterobacter cancerogenus]